MYVDNVIEKVYLKVDEEGSETIVVITLKGGMMCCIDEKEIIEVLVDRPFLFMIRDKNNDNDDNMLFIAKVNKFINNK